MQFTSISQINTVVLFWKAIKACTSTSKCSSTSDQLRHQLPKKYASCTVFNVFKDVNFNTLFLFWTWTGTRMGWSRRRPVVPVRHKRAAQSVNSTEPSKHQKRAEQTLGISMLAGVIKPGTADIHFWKWAQNRCDFNSNFLQVKNKHSFQI